MKITLYAIMIGVVFACAPAQTETAATDTTDTAVAELDTVSIATNVDEPIEDSEMYDADPPEGQDELPGRLVGDEYEILNRYGLVSDPFAFSLDSATLQALLGEEAVIDAIHTPDGEDEEGPYSGYSFYTVKAGETELRFYSYTGKHYADIYTPLLELSNGLKVGMTKEEVIEAMGLDDDAMKANKFTINDDYGSMSFFFVDGKISNIYVSYEEGD